VPRVPTAQQPPELALDVLRKRLAIVLARVRQERLQKLAHQRVQHLALRLAPLVLEALSLGSRACCGGHLRTSERSPCQQRSAEICPHSVTRQWRSPVPTGGPTPVDRRQFVLPPDLDGVGELILLRNELSNSTNGDQPGLVWQDGAAESRSLEASAPASCAAAVGSLPLEVSPQAAAASIKALAKSGKPRLERSVPARRAQAGVGCAYDALQGNLPHCIPLPLPVIPVTLRTRER